jgi:hypothetical protein
MPLGPQLGSWSSPAWRAAAGERPIDGCGGEHSGGGELAERKRGLVERVVPVSFGRLGDAPGSSFQCGLGVITDMCNGPQ